MGCLRNCGKRFVFYVGIQQAARRNTSTRRAVFWRGNVINDTNTVTMSPPVQFSYSVMSSSLRPHGLQHTRLPCPSPTPGAYSNSCPWCQWWHPTISSSVIPFSSCLQSFPASGSFTMSRFFTSGAQSIGFSFSISPSNEYLGLISFRMVCLDLLAVQVTLKSLQQHSSKASILLRSAFFIVQLLGQEGPTVFLFSYPSHSPTFWKVSLT